MYINDNERFFQGFLFFYMETHVYDTTTFLE